MTARLPLLALTVALACAGTQDPASTTPGSDDVARSAEASSPRSRAKRRDQPDELAELAVPAGEAVEVLTFDGLDAESVPAESVGGIAPRRKKIESFELFGSGGRGGPG